MGDDVTRQPHIIGLTGSFGSGCTYIGQHVLEKRGYSRISLSDILREKFREAKKPDTASVPRRALQDFGDELRNNKGHGILAEEAVRRIGKQTADRKWVVDSIRNPAEVHAFRNFSQRFFLFGVYADKEVRWKRVEAVYDGNHKAFDEDDKNDTGDGSLPYGQRVGDCFYEADVVISNDKAISAIGNREFEELEGRINTYVDLVSRPLSRKQPIRCEEALMTMAYAASQQSSCMKRKVGALIVDDTGTVVSSGFNEVPGNERPCQQEFTKCYRDRLSENFFSDLAREFPEISSKAEAVRVFFRKQFRMLDYCRALHAEENAILNLARNARAVSLDHCTLYTTTYPCRLCAQKIVTVGIKRIVYLEPYPDPEAKAILRRGQRPVTDEFFEGVTFKAYFRIYGEER